MTATQEDSRQYFNGAYYNKDNHGKITVSIPIQFRRREEHKIIRFPQEVKEDNLNSWNTEVTPLQKALAQGYRWMNMIYSGEVQTLNEIAEKEGIDKRYVSRVANLTFLSPELIEGILNDELPEALNLLKLGINPALVWGGAE